LYRIWRCSGTHLTNIISSTLLADVQLLKVGCQQRDMRFEIFTLSWTWSRKYIIINVEQKVVFFENVSENGFKNRTLVKDSKFVMNCHLRGNLATPILMKDMRGYFLVDSKSRVA
jgi:hypothetical protein